MRAYVHQAALLCEDCGDRRREVIRNDPNMQDRVPADPTDESSFDSDDFPKGPYPEGGGEADHPQHCDACREFLANPLTETGSAALKRRFKDGDLPPKIHEIYKDAYPNEWSEACEEMEMDAAPSP